MLLLSSLSASFSSFLLSLFLMSKSVTFFFDSLLLDLSSVVGISVIVFPGLKLFIEILFFFFTKSGEKILVFAFRVVGSMSFSSFSSSFFVMVDKNLCNFIVFFKLLFLNFSFLNKPSSIPSILLKISSTGLDTWL